jgi:Holliday junction resolvase-like predicted endonuclease
MDEKQQKGVSSELIAEYYLTKAGYIVYSKKSVQSPVDLIAINPEDGEILLVDVKTASIRQTNFQKGTTIRRSANEEQKRLNVCFLYVYDNKMCELIMYKDNTRITKILNEVLV